MNSAVLPLSRLKIVLLALVMCLTRQDANAQSEAVKRQIESAKKQTAAVSRLQVIKQSAQVPWLDQDEADAPTGKSADCDAIDPQQLQTLIDSVATTSVSRELIGAVIRQESANRPCAVSIKGAMGLMQLMPDVAREMSVDDPFDPRQNLQAGVRYLGQLLQRYNRDLPRALAAYNAGPARVDAANGIPDIEETQLYVKNIMARLKRAAAGS
jgi:soluble lytic murein transglycosylase-like protein